ncbi:MAG: hypothetical protein SO206_06630 [Bacilli bacterium]|nr:hypothetical protein [Bacilli bacterium]
MTLDEAIEQFKYDAECNRADLDLSYAEDNDQVAEWLEDYKHIKQWKSDIMDEFCKYDVNSFEELVTNTRNKAIDDFAKEICKMIIQSENNGNYRFYAVEIKQAIANLAEQLKAGEQNE